MLKEIIYKYHIGNSRNYKFLSVNYASLWCPDRPYVMCASPTIQIRVTLTRAHAAPCGEDSGCAAPVKPPTGTDWEPDCWISNLLVSVSSGLVSR